MGFFDPFCGAADVGELKSDLNSVKNDVETHINNNDIHVTASDKSNWDSKLDKNQGTNNSGKVLGTNANGEVIPLNGYGFEYDEETKMLKYGTDPTSNLNQGIGLDDTLSKTGYAADAGAVGELKTDLVKKIDKPTTEDNNKFPRAKDGSVEWVEHGLPTDEQTDSAIANWLNSHPEATTTVEDNSLTIDKMVIGTLGYVTPEMFGAEGNGITDDSDAIDKCFNSNQFVHLKNNAIYLVKRHIDVNASNIVVYGNNATIKIDYTCETNNPTFTFHNKATIKDVKFKCTTLSRNGGVVFADVTTKDTVIDGCVFFGFGLYGVLNCSTVINTLFEKCCLLTGGNNDGNGYYFSCRNDVLIDKCTFICYGGGDEYDHAIYCGGSYYSNIRITNNTLILKTESTSFGPLLNIGGPANEIQDNCIISGNYIDFSKSKAYYQAALALSLKNSVVSNNIVVAAKNVGGASLFIMDAENVIITNNVIKNNLISISKGNGITITNNTIGASIRFYGDNVETLQNITIKNNDITGKITAPDKYFKNATISSNKIKGSIYFLYGAVCSNILIRDNYIDSKDNSFGIVIGKYNDVLVERNTVISNSNGDVNTRGIVFHWDYSSLRTNCICKDNYVQATRGEDYYLVNVVSINNIGKNNTVVT